MRTVLALLLIVPAFAGCLTGTDDVMESQAVTDTRYLDAFGGLAESPDYVQVPIEWSWTEWFQGALPPAWTTDEFTSDRLVESASVTIQYSAETSLAHTDTRPPFTIWFGIGDALLGNSIVEHAFAAGPNPWDGSSQTITFEVDGLPQGGLPVLPGQRILLYVGSYYTDSSEQGTVQVDLEHSSITYTHRPLDFPGGTYDSPVGFNAQLQGGLCVTGVEVDDSARAAFAIEVPDDADGLIVRAYNQGGVGIGPDIDFSIFDAEGTRVAHAAGPAGQEGIYLYGPNMDVAVAGEWTIEVYNCQHQIAEVAISTQLFHTL